MMPTPRYSGAWSPFRCRQRRLTNARAQKLLQTARELGGGDALAVRSSSCVELQHALDVPMPFDVLVQCDCFYSQQFTRHTART